MAGNDLWRDTEKSFSALCETIAALRHPVTGCPWDLEQTHSSLRKYMIEEAYEAVEVMDDSVPSDKLKEELGDVLLQVVLNAQLAKDAGIFNIKEVIDGLNAKMIRRHPHVFGEATDKESREKPTIRSKWDEIKAKEKATAISSDGALASKGLFSELKSSSLTPASQLAVAIGSLAKTIQFDWTHAEHVLSQFESEVTELRHEIIAGSSSRRIHAEMGDVFFSLFQLCRHLNINPELAAMDGNRKFLERFKVLESIANTEGCDVRTAGPQKLEDLWQRAKTKQLKDEL
jgi:ATP diphosphatase